MSFSSYIKQLCTFVFSSSLVLGLILGISVFIAGDGSIQMNIQELATAVMNKLPVVVAILNNGYLGMVRQWQELFFDKRYASTCLMQDGSCTVDCSDPREDCPIYIPDFVKLAEAFGVKGFHLRRTGDVTKV